MARQRISSGVSWETTVGYSRAVRVGNLVFVAGTTATGPGGKLVGGSDPEAQAQAIFEKIERALAEAGATMADVVRTRVFLTRVEDWEAVGRAHARFFAETRPANTMLEISRLIGDEYLVEIEADAVIEPPAAAANEHGGAG
jgi:enamine deaminase RidA (YjgF/YER057c/UK114 family)